VVTTAAELPKPSMDRRFHASAAGENVRHRDYAIGAIPMQSPEWHLGVTDLG
jgi:hypothetical protein